MNNRFFVREAPALGSPPLFQIIDGNSGREFEIYYWKDVADNTAERLNQIDNRDNHKENHEPPQQRAPDSQPGGTVEPLCAPD